MRRIGSGAAAVALLLLIACSSTGGEAGTATPTSSASILGPRPASPAVVNILRPKNGAAVPASGGELEVSLTGATLTSVTSQDISPTEGHLHVSVDGTLISMTSGTTQPLGDLTPGRHTISVEFVAADHLPFDPRVVTEGFFEVR